jgi:hypothetical protein
MRATMLVTYSVLFDHVQAYRINDVVRNLASIVSRRGVMRGAAGAFAAAILTRRGEVAAAKRATLETCNPRRLTPGEACYCLCATDPNHPLTEERERHCWTGCDVWNGDVGLL